MTLPINEIVCGDNVEVLRTFPDDCIDLVVTSPPYGELRDYKNHAWDFYDVAYQLSRVIKVGGIIVWIVGDQTVDGSESGESFKQALHFKNEQRLLLFDTMIYHRQASKPPHRKYWQNFEYMFVFSNGKPSTANILKDRPNINRRMGGHNERQKNGDIKATSKRVRFEEHGIRENIWYYKVGGGNIGDAISHQHPAPFPQQLAGDHILTWSNEGDIVLDPFNGGGTTTRMARELGRDFIGIEISEEYCDIARQRISQKLLPGLK